VRTTLDVDDDILQAVKEIAAKERISVGQVISNLVRAALVRPQKARKLQVKNGVPVFAASKGEIVSFERVQQLRHREGV
jgi:hypothetical protein